MPIARKHQIDLAETPYYHCIARCVRRAFLCGEDFVNGRSYEHRKAWVIEQLRVLTDIFAISVCAYAVMSNHYHVVLQVNTKKAAEWSAEEILLRHRRLNRSRFYREDLRLKKKEEIDTIQEELATLTIEDIEIYRNKLTDISAFMGALNEYLARRSNYEDECTGRFWEGRFKSYALLDDAALLTCMAYVDLNPIRAGIATSLEESEFTSIQERLREVSAERNLGLKEGLASFGTLEKQEENLELKTKLVIPSSFEAYHQLVEWTGRQIRGDKTGYISSTVESFFTQFLMEKSEWLATINFFEKRFSWAFGSAARLHHFACIKKLRCIRGSRRSPLFYFAENRKIKTL